MKALTVRNPYAALIAVVNVVDCVLFADLAHDLGRRSVRRRPVVLALERRRPVGPIPWQGKLGLWDYPGRRRGPRAAPRPARHRPRLPCVKAAAGVSRLERLKAELGDANERADKAEAALAAANKVEAVNGEVWRLNQQIARPRKLPPTAGRSRSREQAPAKPPSCTADSSRISRPGAHRGTGSGEHNYATPSARICMSEDRLQTPPAEHRA